MSLKSQSANSARRGEIRAKRTTKQPMGASYRLGPLASRNRKNSALRSVMTKGDAMNRLDRLMTMLNPEKAQMPSAEAALPGRSEPAFDVPERHAMLGTALKPPFPDGTEVAYFALG